MVRSRLAWTLAAALALTGCSERRSEEDPPVKKPSTPIEVWPIDRSASYLTEVRAKPGGRLDDFQTAFVAVEIDPARQSPVTSTARFRIGDRPLLWIAADVHSVVVDRLAFGDLARVDAVRLGRGEAKPIGRVLPATLAALRPRELARFLVEGGIVQTFVHIEAEVRLMSEHDDPRAYEASFIATHVYFTNEENRDDYAFTLTIDKASGEMVVAGGA